MKREFSESTHRSRTLSRFLVLAVLCCCTYRVQAESQAQAAAPPPSPSFNKSSSLLYYMPRSARTFSPRFVGDPVARIGVAQDFHSNAIVWHYAGNHTSFDGDLVDEAFARMNLAEMNCALPAITRTPADACVDVATGIPIPHHSDQSANPSIFYPDTNMAGWRAMVSGIIQQYAAAGCTSLQQDDSFFMFTRKSLGCYGDRTDTEIKNMIHDYYEWLDTEVVSAFGHRVPITHNKTIFSDDYSNHFMNDLARHIDGVMAEVDPSQNWPERLFDAVHTVNLVQHGMTTVTTLKDTSPLYNRRHISTVYALGGHPIVPWDVFMGAGQPRFYGSPSTFAQYFKLVEDYPDLFDGHGLTDIYIDHYKNAGGIRTLAGNIRGVVGRSNMMAAVRSPAGQNHRIIHVVNWQVSRPGMSNGSHYFTFWLEKSSIPFTPSKLTIHRPGSAPTVRTDIVSEGAEWKFTINQVDIWAVAKLE